MPASITLTVSHLPTSTSFFLSVLHPLNYVYRGRVADTIGFGLPDAAPDFWITQSIPGVPPGPAHVAFPALSRAKVHEFFQAALRAGGKVHGEPALRDECGYYSAAVVDLDGNSIEAVFRPDLLEANKENIADSRSVISATKSASGSRAPSRVSSASKAKSTASSKANSVIPSITGRSSTSKTSSATSSKAPSTASRSAVSRTHTTTGAPSEAPARTTISRSATAPVTTLQPTGNNIVDIINEAKGTISFARELVDQARPLMNTASPPNTVAVPLSSSPQSHGPSDTIVGTLLGVAAGAALHYAFSNRNKPTESASAPVTPPTQRDMAPSESAPSWTQERYYYYHQQPQYRGLPAPSSAASRPYAIEAPQSDFSRGSSARGGQKLLEMIDNDPTLSDFAAASARRSSVSASTMRPRRRSSFSGIESRASAVPSRKSSTSRRVLEGTPPTSYHAPTAITMLSDGTKSRRSRASSLSRSTSRPADEGYASASEDRRSRASHSTHRSHHSQRPTLAPPSQSQTSRRSSSTVITAIKTPTLNPSPTPSQTALPHSRATSNIDGSNQSFYSMAPSKTHKTVIGRLTEKQLSKLEEGGRLAKGNTDVTRSVIGKVKDVDKLDLSPKEIGPEDSVSQVSSSRGSRRSRR